MNHCPWLRTKPKPPFAGGLELLPPPSRCRSGWCFLPGTGHHGFYTSAERVLFARQGAKYFPSAPLSPFTPHSCLRWRARSDDLVSRMKNPGLTQVESLWDGSPEAGSKIWHCDTRCTGTGCPSLGFCVVLDTEFVETQPNEKTGTMCSEGTNE